MLFLAGYVAGFSGEANFGIGQHPSLMRLLSVFMVMLLLAYGAAFSERKDPIAIRRLLQALARRQWSRALTNFPLWLSSLLVPEGESQRRSEADDSLRALLRRPDVAAFLLSCFLLLIFLIME